MDEASNTTTSSNTEVPLVNPGRPRDDLREQAILDAALALVAEVGYERLTMDAIASRAKASKATIYRRWTGKHELVVDAMNCYVDGNLTDPEDTGTLRGDLAGLVHQMTASIKGFDGRLILGLAQAALTDPGLCNALEEQNGSAKLRLPRIVVERAIARGELPATADPLVFIEIAPAVVIMRVINGQTIDEPFLDHLIDDILLPVLRHPPTFPQPLFRRPDGPTAENVPTETSDPQDLKPPTPPRSTAP